MKKILMLALLALATAAYSQELSKAELDEVPGMKDKKTEAVENDEPVLRPDPQKTMAELSTALKLSSKQIERLFAAINKKKDEFDRLMAEYEKNAAEEKKWRYKMNANHYEMVKLNRELPDAIREFLDDDQRQSYDQILEAAKKPAAAAIEQAPAADESAPKPARKKRLVRRKKIPAGGAAAPAAAAAAQSEEEGQVMVDKESPGDRPAPRKKRVLRKKAALRLEPAAAEEPAKEIAKEPAEEPVTEEEPAGAKPTGKEAAPAEEDAGSYP